MALDNNLPSLPSSESHEREMIALLQSYVKVGREQLREEESYQKAPLCMDHLNGRHPWMKSGAISKTHDNRIRLNAYQIASALTDVRPIWNYDTQRDDLKRQAEIYSKLTRSWWGARSNDKPLMSAIIWALAAGSSYLFQQWNPDLPGGGDIELLPVDGRDVVPIGATYSESIQDWQGVIVRETVTAASLKERFPTKTLQIDRSTGSWFESSGPRRKGLGTGIKGAMLGWLTRSQVDVTPLPNGTVDLLKVYCKDYSRNDSDQPREMGKEGSTYTVQPGERLYPRGRCILAVENGILDDFPNHYWHGLFPLTRLTLLPVPWLLMGLSVIADVLPLQNALNEWVRGTEDGANLWIRRSVVADKRAITEEKLKAIDPRRSQNISINGLQGQGFNFADGPTFPAWWLEWGALLKNEIDEAMGVKGLQQVLIQAKQIPSKDALEQIEDSLSPLLKIMSRSVETALSEAAYMYRFNVDQFYTTTRRFQILGPDGVTKEDVDHDPGNMIPAEGGEGYVAPTMERALDYGKNFSFQVARNTMLTVANTTQRLTNIQLFGRNALDIWSMLESMDIQNVGKAPAETVIERLIEAKKLGLQPGPDPQVVEAQRALVLAQAEMALRQLAMQAQMGGVPPGGPAQGGGAPLGTGGPPGPGGGQPPEIPPVRTNGVGPQGGRPPSDRVQPHFEQKDQGTRTTISTS